MLSRDEVPRMCSWDEVPLMFSWDEVPLMFKWDEVPHWCVDVTGLPIIWYPAHEQVLKAVAINQRNMVSTVYYYGV